MHARHYCVFADGQHNSLIELCFQPTVCCAQHFNVPLLLMTQSIPCLCCLSRREWRLMQSTFSWWALALATAHTMLLAPVPAWRYEKHTWPAGIPTITLISVAPCLLVIFIKMVLVLPPFPKYLDRIRAGNYKKGSMQAVFC